MKIAASLLLLTFFIFFSCTKEKINVSRIYPTDNAGNLIGAAPNDNQWQQQSFSDKEMALFDDLDTADLSGTTMPTIANSYYALPNPFTFSIQVGCTFTQALNNNVIVKYVVVNKNFSVVTKKALRKFASNGLAFVVSGDFGAGNYRLYFTYSAEGHEHFFKSWGNIKKL